MDQDRRRCQLWSDGEIRLPRWFLLLALMIGMPLPAPLVADVVVLATGDTAGHLDACDSCPQTTGLGGLTRRGKAFEAAAADDAAVRVDAGNALFGAQSLPSGGRVIADVYRAQGYHAVNLSYRDFRLGKAATLELVEQSGLPAVSANVLDAQTGLPLVPAYRVVAVGEQRVVVVGLSDPPPDPADAPHLEGQLAGIRFADPAAALRDVLAEARQQADQVVVLMYGSASLAQVAEIAEKEVAAIVVAGVEPQTLPASQQPIVAGVRKHGTAITRVALNGEASVSEVQVEADLAADPEIERLINRHRAPAPLAATRSAPGAAAQSPDPIAHGSNRALRLDVISALVTDRFAGLAAGAERKLVVLEVRFENTLPLDLAFGMDYGEGGKVASMSRQVFLVAGESSVYRLAAGAAGEEDHLPESVELPHVGATAEGKLVFEVAADALPELTLRFYSQTFAPIVVPLTLEGLSGSAKPSPVAAPPQQNDLMRIAVAGWQVERKWRGREAPDGTAFVIVDLRGRSLQTQPTAARALKAGAAADARAELGFVMDYLQAPQLLQLLIDGRYAQVRDLELGTLAVEPVLLPDLMAGGRAVFLAPIDAQSLELVCNFPQFKLTTGEDLAIPKPMRFALKEAAENAAAVEPIAAVEDDPVAMQIVGRALHDRFGAHSPGEGQRLLAVEVMLHNTGETGGVFEVASRFKVAGDRPRAVTGPGGVPLADAVYLPAGERRGVFVVFEVGTELASPLLSYSGVKVARDVALQLGDAPAAVAVQRDPPEPEERQGVLPAAPSAMPATDGDERASVTTGAPVPQGLTGVGLTAEQVNAAIDRGAAFLWQHVQTKAAERNRQPGHEPEDLLAALALVHADWQERDPAFAAAVPRMIAEANLRQLNTYGRSVLAMLIEGYGDPTHLPKLREIGHLFVEQQEPDGSWGYTPAGEIPPRDGNGEHGALMVLGGTPIVRGNDGAATAVERWERLRPLDVGRGGGDNSTSQFALLGLRSLAATGSVALPEQSWTRAADMYRQRQCGDGGWIYHGGGKSSRGYGSMTCAGITSIVIARHYLGLEPADDPAVRRGLEWLDENWSLTTNPRKGQYHFYYLYSLERVGRLLDSEFIGQREWYPLGARYLVDDQEADGRWIERNETEDPRLATSFALLFLTRATPTLDVPIETGGTGRLLTQVRAPQGQRVHVILDCSGSMLAQIGDHTKFQLARDAVTSLLDALPEDAQLGLRVYGHRTSALDKDADKDTQLLLPVAAVDRERFREVLDSLRARGKTPLTLSLEQARGDVISVSERNPVTVVLLTDGGEDSAQADPVAAAKALASRQGVRLIVIGFDITREDWSQQLRQMATAAGGLYVPAARAEELSARLRQAVLGIPEQFAVLDAEGRQAAAEPFGKSIELPEGEYRVVAEFAGRRFEQPAWINTNRTTSAIFDASLIHRSEGAPSTDPAESADPPAAPRYCTQCGQALARGGRFCTGCGARITEE